ncbi:unnamed protein product [Phytomonas sp. EM1]|nr:unnamed protein product [Phytomonas sp. EM1]|eukprot:CCW61339.1 unnamed protein product [Phytomonas sp. isolate EM1]
MMLEGGTVRLHITNKHISHKWKMPFA